MYWSLALLVCVSAVAAQDTPAPFCDDKSFLMRLFSCGRFDTRLVSMFGGLLVHINGKNYQEAYLFSASKVANEPCQDPALQTAVKQGLQCIHDEMTTCQPAEVGKYPEINALKSFIDNVCTDPSLDLSCYGQVSNSASTDTKCGGSGDAPRSVCDGWNHVMDCLSDEVKATCGDSSGNYVAKMKGDLLPPACKTA